MVEIIEIQSLEEKTREKAGEVFRILEENGLFVQEFSMGFQVINRLLQSRKLEEHQETVWHIKKGEWRWWDTARFTLRDSEILNAVVISLSTNTVTFLVFSRSALLPDISNIAEQIEARSDLKVKIVRF